MTDDKPSDSETAALASLHSSEIAANVGELQATTTMVLGLLAYLGGTIYILEDLEPLQLALLPLGPIFVCSYQALRAAVVVRRAELARKYEARILLAAGFPQAEIGANKVGSGFYNRLDDLNVILAEAKSSKLAYFRLVLAFISFAGLYMTALAYTGMVIAEVLERSSSDQANWVYVYVGIWLILLIGGATLFSASDGVPDSE